MTNERTTLRHRFSTRSFSAPTRRFSKWQGPLGFGQPVIFVRWEASTGPQGSSWALRRQFWLWLRSLRSSDRIIWRATNHLSLAETQTFFHVVGYRNRALGKSVCCITRARLICLWIVGVTSLVLDDAEVEGSTYLVHLELWGSATTSETWKGLVSNYAARFGEPWFLNC